MSAFQQLASIDDENGLHRARPLATEERAFRRLKQRILGSDVLYPVSQKPSESTSTPGKEDEEVEADPESDKTRRAEDYQKLRDDILVDFAAFEANIVRTQLLFASNAKERERYAAEKLRIQEEADNVRNDTADLRGQLELAQQTLERRKGWDRLAEKITNNRMLRAREEQHANIDKLNTEIAELEQESKNYAATWAERRQQFDRIVDEGMQMLRLIKDEKEEVERREGMEGQDDGDDGDANSARGRISNAGTPRPDGGATPGYVGAETDQGGLLPPRVRSARGSPAPDVEAGTPRKSTGEDEDMEDEGEVEDDEHEGTGDDAKNEMDTR